MQTQNNQMNNNNNENSKTAISCRGLQESNCADLQ